MGIKSQSCRRLCCLTAKIPCQVFKMGGNAYHAGIVGAVGKSRYVGAPALLCTQRKKLLAQCSIGRNSAGNGNLLNACKQCRLLELVEQDAHDALLNGSAKVGQFLLNKGRVRFLLFFDKIAEGSLEATEAEVQPVELGFRKMITHLALPGQPVNMGTRRVG